MAHGCKEITVLLKARVKGLAFKLHFLLGVLCNLLLGEGGAFPRKLLKEHVLRAAYISVLTGTECP
jgi:hypothetical protein